MSAHDKQKLLENASIECTLEKPGRKIITNPFWAQVITPGSTQSAANIVKRARLSAAIAEERVKEVISEYEALGVPFRWNITPFTEPNTIRKHLEINGMSLLYEALGMVAPAVELVRPFDSKIEVREAKLDDLDLYLDTFLRSWEQPWELREEFRNDLYLSYLDKMRMFRGFIAFYEGVPVGTGGMFLVPSGAYLVAGAIEKNYRGKGIYKALLSARAKMALSEGKEKLLMHAKKLTSAPICARMGFESVCEHVVYSRE